MLGGYLLYSDQGYCQLNGTLPLLASIYRVTLNSTGDQ
jgi:hypothetical protein